MQEALPYKTWTSFPTNQKNTSIIIEGGALSKDDMRHLVLENALIVFGRRGCCMTHVVNHLLQGLGVNPVVYEIDEQDENNLISDLQMIDAEVGKDDNRLQFPVVFIGGRLFGGLDRVMATHITGELIPILKQARALWL